MERVYYWLMMLANSMCKYYAEKHEKWTNKFWEWREKFLNLYINGGGTDNADHD